MITLENEVDVKIKELCEAISKDPVVLAAGSKIDAFSADSDAQALYSNVQEKGSDLQYRQQVGLEIASDEMAEFETLRSSLLENEKVRNFLESQQVLGDLHKKLTQYLSLTIESGDVPSEEQVAESMSGGCCGGSGGGGCGCN